MTDQIWRAMDQTWPAAAVSKVKGWDIRVGKGGGQRVSCTSTTLMPHPDLADALKAQDELGIPALFRVVPGQEALDQALADIGFVIRDRSRLFMMEIEDRPLPPVTAFPIWPPLEIMKHIWASGGISEARLAVMERADMPKTAILGRREDRAAGVAFVAASAQMAMLHGLEILDHMRGKGLGTALVHAACNWGASQGCTHLALAVADANQDACAFYTALGMTPAGSYHYRAREKGDRHE